MDSDLIDLAQLPREIPAVLYETGRRRIVSELGRKDGVLSIYDYGTVKHPGISDLDILVVFESDPPEWLPDLSTDFDPLVDELVGHGNLIMLDRSTFENLHYIDPRLMPRHLSGERIKLKNVDSETAMFRDHASVVDWLPERVYQIQQLRLRLELPVMRSLQLLKSLSYSFRIIDNKVGFEAGIDFEDQIDELRTNWFEYSEEEQKKALLICINDGARVGRMALETWFGQRPKAVFGPGCPNSPAEAAISYFNGLVYATGSPEYDRYAGLDIISIPAEWFDHFRAYAAHDSDLGRLIKKSFVGDSCSKFVLSEGYRDFLDRKLDLCSRNFEWVRDGNLEAGAFRFGFMLNKCDWDIEQFERLSQLLSQIATK